MEQLRLLPINCRLLRENFEFQFSPYNEIIFQKLYSTYVVGWNQGKSENFANRRKLFLLVVAVWWNFVKLLKKAKYKNRREN